MNPQPVVVVLGFCTAVMLCGWLVQQRRRNAALADLLWAACISASALYYGVVADGGLLSRLLVAMMGGLGGFRLFMHLLQRMLIEPADSRHRALRERAQSNLAWMLAFFVSRAFSATLFSVPLYVAASNPQDQASAWTLLAAGVYLAGLSGEAYSDIQLAQFRDQPRHRGRTCRRGLWRYSRHPNYFFAFVHWCSYALLAVGLPWSVWSLTLLAPALTAVMAFRRIPAVEAAALRTRGEDYRSYQETTSILVPWFPNGWPNDAAAAAAWYTPPPPSRAAVSARAAPLPGARITPSPSSRVPVDGPITPQPQRVLAQRVETPAIAEPASTVPVGEVDG
jgi:steroid 5-alpha reductase family enzyme